MNKYDTVLRLFVDSSQYGDFTNVPFRQDCRIYATDKLSIISVGSDLTEEQYDFLEKPDFYRVLNKPQNRNKVFTLGGLSNLLSRIPKVKFKKCDACDGLGEVNFEFEYDAGTYYHRGDCPICDGTGKVELLFEEFDFRYGVKFESDTWPLKHNQLIKLIKTMDLLHTDAAELVFADTQTCKFKLVNDIEVMFCAYHPKQEFEDFVVCYEE